MPPLPPEIDRGNLFGIHYLTNYLLDNVLCDDSYEFYKYKNHIYGYVQANVTNIPMNDIGSNLGLNKKQW